jgi:major vault protein
MANDQSQRDLVLDVGTYAFIRDRTQGALKVCTGPTTVTPSQSDEPVKFDPKIGRFISCGLDTVIQPNVTAKEGSYIVLENPASDAKQPKPEMKGVASYALNIGSKVVVPGPADFPLWPRQSAEVIDGHHLTSNQFLLVRIYHEELARKNHHAARRHPDQRAGR